MEDAACNRLAELVLNNEEVMSATGWGYCGLLPCALQIPRTPPCGSSGRVYHKP